VLDSSPVSGSGSVPPDAAEVVFGASGEPKAALASSTGAQRSAVPPALPRGTAALLGSCPWAPLAGPGTWSPRWWRPRPRRRSPWGGPVAPPSRTARLRRGRGHFAAATAPAKWAGTVRGRAGRGDLPARRRAGRAAATARRGPHRVRRAPGRDLERRLLPDRHPAAGSRPGRRRLVPARARAGRPGAAPVVRRPPGPPARLPDPDPDLCPTTSAAPRLDGVVRRRRAATCCSTRGVHDDADQLLATSADGWTAGTPTAVGLEPDRGAPLAVGMNGEALPREHGFPRADGGAGPPRLRLQHEVAHGSGADDVRRPAGVLGAARVGGPRADQDAVADRHAAGRPGPGACRWPGRPGRSTSASTGWRCAPTAGRGTRRSSVRR
jgi:hypothetical protein